MKTVSMDLEKLSGVVSKKVVKRDNVQETKYKIK